MLDEPHVRIGLGGIAKGYAVDQAAKVLLDAGLTSFYVQAGGDLYAHGKKPDGSPWPAGIRDPRGPEGDYFAMMPVSDHAFSTAGDYERSLRRRRQALPPHHRSAHGLPGDGVAAASRSGRRPRSWPTRSTTPCSSSGPRRASTLVESLDGVGAVIVDAHNNVWT